MPNPYADIASLAAQRASQRPSKPTARTRAAARAYAESLSSGPLADAAAVARVNADHSEAQRLRAVHDSYIRDGAQATKPYTTKR